MVNKKLKIGIVGCGTIGSCLAKAIEQRFLEDAQLVAVCDIERNKAEGLKEQTASRPKVLSLDELVNACDLIIEAASASVAAEVAEKALLRNKDVMIMSVGGILDRAKQLFELAKRKDARIYLPSGALAGLDAVKSAAMANISKATLTTRKPPKGLAGAPYLADNKIDLSRIKTETPVFEGLATEAVRGFPKNVNVCAALSLAGIGPEKTRVRILTSPEYKTNSHEIELEGDFGRLLARTENLPAPENPKTSFLASLSAIATLNNILNVVKIGT
jgi:aspartate dehydrogenase